GRERLRVRGHGPTGGVRAEHPGLPGDPGGGPRGHHLLRAGQPGCRPALYPAGSEDSIRMSMNAPAADRPGVVEAGVRRRGLLYRRLGRNLSLLLGGLLVAAFVLMALLGPRLAPHDPFEMALDAKFQRPSVEHWAGTDQFGRDVFSRVLHGAGTSLLAAVTAEGIALAAGTLIGLMSGFIRGRFDLIVQRIVEILMAFPGLLLAVVIVAVLGPGLVNVMIAVGLAGIPSYVRLV